jgi:2-polyprenyl-3-methyl-5-hydroxy-6-metoxy-1,4-benzoquinol methylase
MLLAERLLYFLAKLLYKSEMGHSNEMKTALSDRSEYNRYRLAQIDRILAVAQKYKISIKDKVVLDLGCSDGTITLGYLEHGAREVIGVDIDEAAIQKAKKCAPGPGVSFRASGTASLPLAADHVEVVICFDVFEHIAEPGAMLGECHRVLKPGGKMLIGTWGWYHPFAPHLWSTMPVPWAQVFFSEKTLLRTCRRVYQSSWYVPTMNDFDEHGKRIEKKYLDEAISTAYLNKLLIMDFEKLFAKSRFQYRVFSVPFGSRYARWTKVFLRTPWLREFITSYIWVVLTKRE